ncbi:MAG: hypothetical protein PVJ57_21610 [Phycisphaerae bacterium]
MKRIPPGLALLLLAPLLGELVSGHMGPAEFFNPLAFVIMALPYGFGAVLVRELLIRWDKRWPSLVLLGLAYGVYEEAIVVRSIFNADWHELTPGVSYGYVGGVHAGYGLMLLHFHLVVSIGASILLAHVLYRERRKQPWLGRGMLVACAAGLLLWLPVGWLLTDYRPPVLHYVMAWLVLLTLVIAARFAPNQLVAVEPRQAPRARWFFVLGCVNVTTVFIGLGYALENGTPPFPLVFTILVLLNVACLTLLVHWSGEGRTWRDSQRLAWIAGTLAFFIVFGATQDAEQWQGKSLVSLVAAVALWRLSRRIRRRERLDAAGEADVAPEQV